MAADGREVFNNMRDIRYVCLVPCICRKQNNYAWHGQCVQHLVFLESRSNDFLVKVARNEDWRGYISKLLACACAGGFLECGALGILLAASTALAGACLIESAEPWHCECKGSKDVKALSR